MSITAHVGPVIAYRGNPLGSVGGGGNNPDAAPNTLLHGTALLDQRQPFTYAPGGSSTAICYGWLATECQVINQVPSTIADNNIAASQSPATAALTLVSSSGAGITVGTSITRADTGAAVTGLLAIDTAMAGTSFSQNASVNMWDPTKAISRNVRITSGGNDTGISFLVVGYDLYGYPMSEAITGASGGVASGVKAFKYISSITPSGSVATTAKAGTGDVIGLPIRCDVAGMTRIFWNNAWVTASTGFTAAVTTDPATTTTGDVRGTYALQAASNNTLRLVMFISPSVANIGTVTGQYGVAQNLANNNGA